ncbi:MAG: UDP-N-acetylmuramoyl-L-alanine--D-glutamate ligase [Spirochaetaceae bacterium]|nr:UDP-N-acetylmuramoyl-L-alanine--D-glutamate ligase [Spirochaetaceae bacterium]
MPHYYSKICPFSSLESIKGKNVLIMGLGLNGGGLASVLFFSRYGANVTVTDMKTEQDLKASIEEIEHSLGADSAKIRYVLGEHRIEDFENTDCVIKNPGVKYENNKYLAAAKNIETDISIFLRFSKAPIIAVTGSKGKSSTVSAIHYGLEQAGFKTFLGGNITVSPLTFLEETTENTPVVLELSSWQLADLRGRGILKPKVSVLTTIVPDHQNWYGNMESYVADKKLIYADQTADDFTICKYDDWGKVFASETKGTVIWYSAENPYSPEMTNVAWLNEKGEGFFKTPDNKTNCILGDKLSVPGFHMKENLLKAALVMDLFGVSPERTVEILRQYTGIPHRLEQFYSWNGFVFYNDSAATVPEATIAALKAFDEKLILIAGGTDKNCSFDGLAGVLKEESGKKHLLDMYLLAGTGTEKLMSFMDKEYFTTIPVFDSLEKLLAELKDNLLTKYKGKNCKIVFSPGATSFGMFKNEFDRGNTYKEMVKKVFN